MGVLRHAAKWTQDEWAYMEREQPNAKAITERPQVDDWFREYWTCFQELSGARTAGWSPDPIGCADVEAWCRLHAVAEDRRPSFWRVVHALDLEALKLAAARAKK